jgi:MSHA biogenesis protein MshO
MALYVQRPCHHRGFTLVEMIVSITILGILAVTLVPMMRMPMVAYLDAARRADAGGELDVTATKLRDDLALALPGSVRVLQIGTRYRLEYLEVRAVGRFRAGNVPGPQSCPATCLGVGANDVLEAACNDSCFTTLGPLVMQPGATAVVPGSDYVVINPLGYPVAAGPYQGGAATPAGTVKGRLLTLTPIVNGNRITLTAHAYPSPLPNDRQFYVVSTPVTYDCNPAPLPAGGTLTRLWGYPIAQVQPTVFAAATSSAVLATGVTACQFVAPALGSAGRAASVWLRLGRRTGDSLSEEYSDFAYNFGVRGEP